MGLLVACADSGDRRPVVHMLAPVALQPVLDSAVAHWELEHNAEVRVGYDTPDRLQRQADGGTRADLFVAADRRWMDALQDDGHVAPLERQALALDPLVFVSQLPRSPVRDPSQLIDSQGPGGALLVGLVTDDLPEGIVARQALQDAQVWSAVESQVVRFSTGSALRAALEHGDVAVGVCRRSTVMSAFDTLSTHPFGPDQRYGSVIEVAVMQRGDTPASPNSQSLAASLVTGPGARDRWMQAGLMRGGDRGDARGGSAAAPPRLDGPQFGPSRGPGMPPDTAQSQGASPPLSPASSQGPPTRPSGQDLPGSPHQPRPGQVPGSPAR